MNCDRCNKKTNQYMMSFFNEDLCCLNCIEVEKSHPKYKYAREVELNHCKNKNYNFKGVGLPEDLNRYKIKKKIY